MIGACVTNANGALADRLTSRVVSIISLQIILSPMVVMFMDPNFDCAWSRGFICGLRDSKAVILADL